MTCSHKFVDSNVCLKCGVSFAELRAADAAERAAYELQDALGRAAVETYTDDVIAVMRATIDQLRRDVAALRELNEQLRKDAERFQAVINGSPLPEGM